MLLLYLLMCFSLASIPETDIIGSNLNIHSRVFRSISCLRAFKRFIAAGDYDGAVGCLDSGTAKEVENRYAEDKALFIEELKDKASGPFRLKSYKISKDTITLDLIKRAEPVEARDSAVKSAAYYFTREKNGRMRLKRFVLFVDNEKYWELFSDTYALEEKGIGVLVGYIRLPSNINPEDSDVFLSIWRGRALVNTQLVHPKNEPIDRSLIPFHIELPYGEYDIFAVVDANEPFCYPNKDNYNCRPLAGDYFGHEKGMLVDNKHTMQPLQIDADQHIVALSRAVDIDNIVLKDAWLDCSNPKDIILLLENKGTRPVWFSNLKVVVNGVEIDGSPDYGYSAYIMPKTEKTLTLKGVVLQYLQKAPPTTYYNMQLKLFDQADMSNKWEKDVRNDCGGFYYATKVDKEGNIKGEVRFEKDE